METITVVSALPGARYYGFYAIFPEIANQAFASEQRGLDAINNQAAANFDYRCKQWLSDAALARTAGTALPPKPISPASRMVVRQDLPNNGGTWIAQTDGPVFGVCPDLGPVVGSTAAPVTGNASTRKADPSEQLAFLVENGQRIEQVLLAIRSKLGA